MERAFADILQRVAEVNRLQGVAVLERAFADILQRVAEVNRLQGSAVSERVVADILQRVAEVNRLQGLAVLERVVADGFDAVRDDVFGFRLETRDERFTVGAEKNAVDRSGAQFVERQTFVGVIER